MQRGVALGLLMLLVLTGGLAAALGPGPAPAEAHAEEPVPGYVLAAAEPGGACAPNGPVLCGSEPCSFRQFSGRPSCEDEAMLGLGPADGHWPPWTTEPRPRLPPLGLLCKVPAARDVFLPHPIAACGGRVLGR